MENQEGDLIMPGDQLGLSTQSAIVAGIFEALRQRYCHRILTELAAWEDCQTIYSTHSSTSPTPHDWIHPFATPRLVKGRPWDVCARTVPIGWIR